jgi:hypothetical protein
MLSGRPLFGVLARIVRRVVVMWVGMGWVFGWDSSGKNGDKDTGGKMGEDGEQTGVSASLRVGAIAGGVGGRGRSLWLRLRLGHGGACASSHQD